MTDPDTAFWALVDKNRVAESLTGSPLLEAYGKEYDRLKRELHAQRFELKPSGVYLNPTERCNLNCTYCYLPGEQRSGGTHMPQKTLVDSLGALHTYFRSVMGQNGDISDRKPRAIFHGAEPLMNRDAVFAAIDQYADDFAFGVQTNGTLLDDAAIELHPAIPGLPRNGRACGTANDTRSILRLLPTRGDASCSTTRPRSLPVPLPASASALPAHWPPKAPS